MLKFTASAIAKEFSARNIPYEIIDEGRGMLKYLHNGTWRYLRSSLDDSASPVGVSIADSKMICSRLVGSIGVKVPGEMTLGDGSDVDEFLRTYGKVVVKPADAAHGNGVTVNISGADELKTACELAHKHSMKGNVIIQEQVSGNDLRVLVIGGKVAAATERVQASIVGDGVSTVMQLIEKENTNPDRGENYMKKLNFIDVSAAETFLKDDIHSVPAKDKVVAVVGAVNIGLGGSAIDRTDVLPAEIAEQACQIAEILHLPVCGVDFMTSDLADHSRYYFIEANACPSFGLHVNPAVGKSQAVDILFVDYLLEKS